MSTYYYLVCKTHKKAVFITNDKGDAPDREEIVDFLHSHVYPGCPIKFANEYDYPAAGKLTHEISSTATA